MKKIIFLTGATGFVGANLLVRLLKGDSTTEVMALIRANTEQHARQRLEDVLHIVSPDTQNEIWNRIQVITGDITLEHLGMNESLYTELTDKVTHIIHSAANVQFILSLDVARKTNVDGTKHVMAFALQAYKSGSLKRVAYVSTAFVSGSRSSVIYENNNEKPTGFANTYEQTKYEADCYVQSLMNRLPIMVFRPSIIVGDSQTGRTSCFNAIYPMMKFLYQHNLSVLPGTPGTTVDVVPVDFVCNALCHIFFQPREKTGKVFHLTAGHQAITLTELANFALRCFRKFLGEPNSHRVTVIPFILYRISKILLSDQHKALSRALEIYAPYLFVRRTFENSNTIASLRGSGIFNPRFTEYGETILQYSVELNWGKRLKQTA